MKIGAKCICLAGRYKGCGVTVVSWHPHEPPLYSCRVAHDNTMIALYEQELSLITKGEDDEQ